MASVSAKKKTSEIWKFFDRIDEGHAICTMCKSKLSYKTSSSNLKKHLQKKHPTVTITFLESKRSTVVAQHKENGQNKESIDNDRPSTSEVSSLNSVEGRTALVEQISHIKIKPGSTIISVYLQKYLLEAKTI
ncbi:unnamed protein product [Acanthoscelides obtectus]|uniref:BED-type domain-containing protein n=1 Tax=Acanthoscelides obtectus TaxID=200917 RepID=A0A9P0JNX8_ACAOB|nr:unnamed protein product [Acanthoscelides obtectus]CAK1673689.1 hypothetical protein AOBTE_LOCUS29415 [Acanthoscelides obtectus]